MTTKEANEQALKQIPRDIRFVKTEDGEYERVDVNIEKRKEYARQLIKNDIRTASEGYADKQIKILETELDLSKYSRSVLMDIKTFDGRNIEAAFIAGAEWMREQLDKEIPKWIKNNGSTHRFPHVMKRILADGETPTSWVYALYLGKYHIDIADLEKLAKED